MRAIVRHPRVFQPFSRGDRLPRKSGRDGISTTSPGGRSTRPFADEIRTRREVPLATRSSDEPEGTPRPGIISWLPLVALDWIFSSSPTGSPRGRQRIATILFYTRISPRAHHAGPERRALYSAWKILGREFGFRSILATLELPCSSTPWRGCASWVSTRLVRAGVTKNLLLATIYGIICGGGRSGLHAQRLHRRTDILPDSQQIYRDPWKEPPDGGHTSDHRRVRLEPRRHVRHMPIYVSSRP